MKGNKTSWTGSWIHHLDCSFHIYISSLAIVTHDNEVAARADRIVRLLDGRVVS